MPSVQHVRRLARELVLPDGADVVIQRPKYWTPGFCWLYFERCDELIWEAPEDGLVAAEAGPELVRLTEIQTRQSHDRLMLRARAVLGTGYQATEELDLAAESYRAGFGLVRKSRYIQRSDLASLLCRFGYLICCQGQISSAVEVAGQSIAIYREAPEHVRRRHLGEALLMRGFMHHREGCLGQAMNDWAEAIVWTDAKLAPRIFFTAIHNIAIGLMQGAIPARELSRVESALTRVSRLLSRELLNVSKLKVRWVLGLIQTRFGSTRRAEATYSRVMNGFLSLGQVVDAVLVGVTLGKQLYRERRVQELTALAVEISDVCDQLCPSEDTMRVVFIWKETAAAGQLTADVFKTTWSLLEQLSFEIATGLTRETSRVPPRIAGDGSCSSLRRIA